MRTIIFLLCFFPTLAHSQLWSGVISSSRAMDWSTVGVVGGIPSRTTQCGSTIAAYSGAATTINNAISACTAGQYVQLGAGTFTLSSGVLHSKSNVTLRGSGADKTILNISGLPSQGCHIGEGRVFNVCTGGGANIGQDSPDNTATWSSGFTQGTTSIVLSSVTNMRVGQTIWLDQLNDASDGFPAAGDVYVCEVAGSNCSNQGGGAYARSGRQLVEAHIVTACGTSTPGAACSSTTVTIYPGVIANTFRSARSPGAWWGNTGSLLEGAGVEDLTIDMTPSGAAGGMFMINCTNCWVTGVRFIKTNTTGTNVFVLMAINVNQSTFSDNYFFGPPTSQIIAVYQTATHVVSNSLFQNNIYHTGPNSLIVNEATWGNVFAYNYVDNVVQGSFIEHGVGGFNLYEGNNGSNIVGDVIHGPHFFETIFRNHFDGSVHNNPGGVQDQAPIVMMSNNRFMNVIGNVMDSGHTSSYQSLLANSQNAIYVLGWQGTGSGTPVSNDTNVLRTLFRWGNWDDVTNATRWCGSSSNTGWSTTCSSTTEVPSAITNFPNSIPATETLPNSFYLSAKPPWFGVLTWPPIGPDVSSGNISGFGGHANRIPARLCFETLLTDASYGANGVKLFLPRLCYGSGSGKAPGALAHPENLK